MRWIALLVCVACTHAEPRPPSPAPEPKRETARFALYKMQQRIGAELAFIDTAADGTREVRDNFTFNDRGADVALAARWSLGPDGAPRAFEAWGMNARTAQLEAHVAAAGDGFDVSGTGATARHLATPRGAFAAASGYAPVIGQELLVRVWQAHGRPAQLTLLPGGEEVRIESRGSESFALEGRTLVLEHLAIHGLVWGREDVFVDPDGRLAGLVTRDAEFDHFEAMRPDAMPLVEKLVARAAADAVAWLGEAVPAQRTGAFALTGGKLLDGTQDAVVVVDGDRIVAAGPRASTPVPAGVAAIDVHGATVLPGLWDMHAHVEQVEQAAAYLAAGVTSVRDVGNIPSFIVAMRDAIDAGRGTGPRIVSDPLVDGDGAHSIGILRIKSADEIGPMLDRIQQLGAIEVKIYSRFPPALVKPFCAEAHRRGLRITGHVPNGMTVTEAIEAGFDGINHIQYVAELAVPQGEADKLSRGERLRRMAALDLHSPPVERAIALMAERKTLFDPTLALDELLSLPLAELQRREPGLATMPEALRGAYQGSDDGAFGAVFPKLVEIVRELHRRGVPIVAGTDIGVPGHSLHRELELYVEAGFTPREAIDAATLVPARFMKRDTELGTVAVGKRADLVVVDGDPLQDIHALRHVRYTVSRGRLYEPAPLWKIAGFRAP